MYNIQFDVNFSKSVAIDVAYDVLSVWWMEVYPIRFNQSESLLHAEIKLLLCHLQSIAAKRDHFVWHLPIYLSGCQVLLVATLFLRVTSCFTGDTSIPWNAVILMNEIFHKIDVFYLYYFY